VLVSTTTWLGPGHRPLTRSSELNCGLDGSTLKPRLGAPPNPTALPLTISWGLPDTPPIASRTSGSARTRVSTDCGNDGAPFGPPLWLEPLDPVSTALRPVTVASVPLLLPHAADSSALARGARARRCPPLRLESCVISRCCEASTSAPAGGFRWPTCERC
jgi:hypothetical protein